MNSQESSMTSVAPPVTWDMPMPKTASSGRLAPWKLKRILSYIEANLETKLRTSDLAAMTELSVGHFSRAFKFSVGKPPHAFVMTRRVERAKQLILLEDPMPLIEVAHRCGLSDQAHLSRMFRKVAGQSPAAWRRRYWSPRLVVEARQPASYPN
jgi:AraC family transcriptional regulator